MSPQAESAAAGSAARGTPTQEVLTEFILSLVQAFLRTGYYLPDHPQAKKAKVGLYSRFMSLFTGRHELSFMVQEMGETRNILVDGPLPETQRLSTLMTRGMAEVYVPRLSKFLERKDLVSLTLKETMSEEEFSFFIDVMGEPSFATLDATTKAQFINQLREKQITHISFVFNEDLVTEDRKLPWRAQLSISRLKKDLKVLPMFQSLDEEGFRSLRKQVIRDVLRPINSPDLMSALLLNSDLAGTKEVPAGEIEDEIVAYVSEKNLVATGVAALEAHLATTEGRDREGRQRALHKFYRRLRTSDAEGVHELIRVFLEKDIIDLQSLPEDLQKQIIVEQETDRYLEERAQILKFFEGSQSADSYRARAGFFFRVIPELIRRSLFDEVLVLVTMLRGHAALRDVRSATASELLQKISSGPIGVSLKEAFLHSKKEDRIALDPLFLTLGVDGLLHLIDILIETEDTWVRKNACEIVLRLGPDAERLLLAALCSGKLPVGAMAEILMVFGEIECQSGTVYKLLQQYLKHKEPKIRAEAVWALCRIRGEEENALFLQLLDDPEMEVKERAIRCLRHIKSRDALPSFMEILRQAEKNPELEPLEIKVYRALAEFPDAEIESGVKTETFLINLLKEAYPKGLRAMLQRGEHRQMSGRVFMTICETLGAMGGQDSVEILKDLSKRVREPGRQRLQKAVHHIESRLSPEAPEHSKEPAPAAAH